jgi:hypothetical protein
MLTRYRGVAIVARPESPPVGRLIWQVEAIGGSCEGFCSLEAAIAEIEKINQSKTIGVTQ